MIFSYSVSYPRTANWWSGGWRDLSDWLDAVVGQCGTDWEYVSEEFLFKTAEDKTLFLLKWA